MKRLLRKANADQALDQYNSIISTLMSNDHNGTWDEIYDEMVDEYGKDRALVQSIDILKDSLARILEEDLDPVGDADEYEFYQQELNRANSIIL